MSQDGGIPARARRSIERWQANSIRGVCGKPLDAKTAQ